MNVAKSLISNGCPKKTVATALNISRSHLYRRLKGPIQGPPRKRKSPMNRISKVEREKILGIMHEEQYIDSTPWEIVPQLLDKGFFYGSVSTFYRVLSENNEVKERRAQSRLGKHAAPILEAFGPNEVWSWDITRLKGPYQGKWFYLYVMLDLFSRYIVGWMIAEQESARLAQHFIRDTVSRHLETGEKVCIHSDRGSPMTANTTKELIDLLGLWQSLSRPRTSDDNPFSEAQFRTVKYHPSFPGFFDNKESAKNHMETFFKWYNNEHMHMGLNLHTPISVHFGKVGEVVSQRQKVLDEAFEKNPERFAKGKPVVKLNPKVVGINLHLKAVKVETVTNQFEEEENSGVLHSVGTLH